MFYLLLSSKIFKGQLNLILAADQLDTSIVTKPDIGSRSGSFNFVNWSGRKMQCDGELEIEESVILLQFNFKVQKCNLAFSATIEGEFQLILGGVLMLLLSV